jgi:protein O-GlcNAc transferase
VKRQTPKQQDSAFHAALALHRADKLDQAALAYRNILKLRPNHSGALNNLGVLCRKQGLFEEASSCFERVLKLSPNHADAWSNLASLYISLGNFEAAVHAAMQATKYAPEHAKGFNNLSFALFRTGQLALAEQASRKALQIDPKIANAWSNLGQILQSQSRETEATDAYKRAKMLDKDINLANSQMPVLTLFDEASSVYLEIKLPTINNSPSKEEIDALVATFKTKSQVDTIAKAKALIAKYPEHFFAWKVLSCVLHDQGQYQQAIQGFEHCLKLNSKDFETFNNLGNTYLDLQRFDKAREMYSQAIDLNPKYSTAHHNLANVLMKTGELEGSIASYIKAISLDPTLIIAHFNMGTVLSVLGRHKEAVNCYVNAIKIQPEHAQSHFGLAVALQKLHFWQDAVQSYKKAIEAKSDYSEAHSNYGNLLYLQGDLSSAKSSLRKAISLAPNLTQAQCNLGSVQIASGEIDEAVVTFQQALQVSPNSKEVFSNLLFCMHFGNRWRMQEIYEYHLKWAQLFELPKLSQPALYQRKHLQAGKVPRIAFMSPDLYAHPVTLFLRPLIANWPHERMELVFYASVKRPDDATHWFEQQANLWVDISGMNDEQAAQRIAKDEVDILIDLSGHTGENRLSVLAHRPAAVQFSWLGYFDTTGMQSVDYLIADSMCVTPQMEPFFTEKVLRLPDDFVCFDPTIDAPEVSELPASSKGYITFGSQNQLAKVTDEVLDLWAMVLQQTPQSRLMFQAKAFNDPEVIRRYSDKFFQRGIESVRIDFIAGCTRQQILQNYCKVDIALDPFPCAGGTTTCESLWMGVPVVTLLGDRFGGRHSASHLSTVGLSQLIAQDPEQYLNIVRDLCADLPHLAKLRAGLQEQMKASPMCDGPRFAKNFEKLLFEIINLEN